MASQITILDVARWANVSPSSVSNLLNGRTDRMRPSTRARIEQAIEQLGYRPNIAARQLKTGHSPIIALIVPSVANPFYGVFARHVGEAALAHGYQMLLGNSERDPQREKSFAEELWDYGVRGMILASSLVAFTHLADLVERGLHLVAFDRPSVGSDRFALDSIGVDNVLGARLATEHLLSLGHRRIAFLSGSIHTVSRMSRLEGYHSSLVAAGLAPDPELLWPDRREGKYGDSEAVEFGRQGARALLARADPPTAIFAINDMYAFGAYVGVRSVGLEIPQDVSVVGFDDIILTQVVRPLLTTVRQPVAEIAYAAVERLVGRLSGTCNEPPSHQMVAPELIVRESTAPVRDDR